MGHRLRAGPQFPTQRPIWLVSRRRHRLSLALAGVTSASLGCEPTVDVFGTYFPPSLVSAAIGLVGCYLLLQLLARRPALRPFSQSALFFASVTVILGFIAWWSLFSDF